MSYCLRLTAKYIALILAFFMLHTDLSFAIGNILPANQGKTKTDQNCLAPRSNCQLVLPKEYGQQNARSHMHAMLKEGSEYVRKKEARKSSFAVAVSSGIGNAAKRVVSFFRNLFSKPVMMLVLIVSLMGIPAGIVHAQSSPSSSPSEYVLQYKQNFEMQINAAGEISDSLVLQLLRDVRTASDPFIARAALGMLDENQQFDELESVIRNRDIDVSIRQEAILVRYNSYFHNLYFLADIVNDLAVSDSTSDDAALCRFALTMAEGEILNVKKETIANDIVTASPQTRWQLVSMLIRVTDQTSNEMVREYAMELLLASFSNLELSWMINGYVENAGAGLTSPIALVNGQIVFANHHLESLTKAAERELERRIAITILNDLANKAVTSHDVIASSVGRANSYGKIFLASAMNNDYQGDLVRQFLPSAYTRIQEDYNRALQQGKNLSFEDVAFLVEIDMSASVLFSDLSHSNETIRAQEMARLMAHNTANNNVLLPVMVQLAATSPFADVRAIALDAINGNPEYLMQLYLYPNVLPAVQNFAYQQLSQLVNDSRGQLVIIAQSNEVFRNGLIRFFQNSTDSAVRGIVFRIYARSVGDPVSLIQFSKTLDDLSLDSSEAAKLEIILHNEVNRIIAMEVARYHILQAESVRRSAAVGVSDADETLYEHLYDALKNTETDITPILTQYPEVQEKVSAWYKHIEDQVFPSPELLGAQNRSFFGNLVVELKNMVSRPLSMWIHFLLGSLVAFLSAFAKFRKDTKRLKEEARDDLIVDDTKEIRVAENPANAVIKNKVKRIVTDAESKKDLSGTEIIELTDMIENYENGYPALTPQQENMLVSIVHTVLKNPQTDKSKHTAAEKLYRLLLTNITHREYSTSDGARSIYSEEDVAKPQSVLGKIFSGKAFLNSDALGDIRNHEDEGKVFFRFLHKSRKVLMANNFIAALLQGLSIVIFYILKQQFLLTQGWMFIGITVLISMAISFVIDTAVSVMTSQMFDKYLSSLVDKLGKNHNIIKSHLPKVYRMTTAETSRWGMFKMFVSSVTIAVALFLIFEPLFLPFVGTVLFAWVWILFAGFTPKIGLHPRQTEYLKAYGQFNQKRDDYRLTGKIFKFEKNWKKMVNSKLMSFIGSSVLFIGGLTLAIGVFIPFLGMAASIPFLGISLMGYLAFFYSSYEFVRRLSEGIMHTDKLKKMMSVIKSDKFAVTAYSWNRRRDKGKEQDADALLKDATIGDVKFENISIFTDGDKSHLILNSQNLEFPKGKIVYMSAPSGSGKSTIGKVLGFKRHHQGGKIMVKLISGKDRDDDPQWEKDDAGNYYRWVEADPNHFDVQTLQEYIQYHPLHVAESNNVLSKMLKTYKIDGPVLDEFLKVATKLIPTFSASQIDQPFATFSPGQRKRLALLIGLFSRNEPQPSHIILDDFFSGLDLKSMNVYLEYIREWQERTGAGVVIFDVTPIPRKYRDKSYSFTHGQLISFNHVEKQHQILDVINTSAEELGGIETEKFINETPLDKLPVDKIFDIVKPYFGLKRADEIEKLKRQEALDSVRKQEEASKDEIVSKQIDEEDTIIQEEGLIEPNEADRQEIDLKDDKKEELALLNDKQDGEDAIIITDEEVVDTDQQVKEETVPLTQTHESINTKQEVEYSLFQYLRNYSKTLPEIDIPVEAVETILNDMDLSAFSILEKKAYLDVSAAKYVLEKIFSKLTLEDDFVIDGVSLELTKTLQKEALFMRMLVDFLKYEPVEKQWSYLQALTKSNKDEDRFLLDIYLESVPGFKEAFKSGVCPKYFNLANTSPMLFYGMIIGTLSKTTVSRYSVLGSAISSLPTNQKKKIASYLTASNKEVMHERFRALLSDIRVSNTNLPTVRNTSDYLHIVTQLVDLGYSPQSGFSKELFKLSPDTFKYKTDFLHKYHLPINSKTIKIIKMTASEEENEVQALTELLSRSFKLLMRNNFLSHQQIEQMPEVIFSQESYKKDSGWQILNEVRVTEPEKFAFLCGKVISELKEWKALVKGLETVFGNSKAQQVVTKKQEVTEKKISEPEVQINNLTQAEEEETGDVISNTEEDVEVTEMDAIIGEIKDDESEIVQEVDTEKSGQELSTNIDGDKVENNTGKQRVETEKQVIVDQPEEVVKQKDDDNSEEIKNKERVENKAQPQQETVSNKRDHKKDVTHPKKEKKKVSRGWGGRIFFAFLISLLLTFNFQGIYRTIVKTVNPSFGTAIPFVAENSSAYRAWNEVLHNSSGQPTGHINTYTQDQASIVETWANVTDQAYTVRAENGGTVTYVRAPGAVKQGDVLIRYSNPQLLAALQQKEGIYSQLLLTYQQNEALVDTGGISRVAFETSKYQMELAKAEVQMIRNQIARMTIRAPHDGMFRFSETVGGVTSVISENMYVQPGQVLGYVSDESPVIQFEIETSQINAVASVGGTIELTIDDTSYTAEVLSIQGKQLREYNTQFTVVCRLPHSASAIQVGESYPISFSYLVDEKNTSPHDDMLTSYNYYSAAGFVVFGEEVTITSPADGYISYEKDMMVGDTAPDQTAIINYDILRQTSMQRQKVAHLQQQYELAQTLVRSEFNISSPDMDQDTLQRFISTRTINERVAYQNAEAELRRLNVLANALSVSIPNEGNWVITQMHARNGEFIPEGTPLFKAVNTASLQVQANVGPQVVSDLELGQNVFVLVDGKMIEGVVTNIQRNELGYAAVRIDVAGEDIPGIPGIPATIFVPRDHASLDSGTILPSTQTQEEINLNMTPADSTKVSNSGEISKIISSSNQQVLEASVPLDVFGVFAGFSLFSIFKRRDKDKKDTVVNFILYLLLSGYSLKGKNTTVDLDDLWNVFRDHNDTNREDAFKEKLRLVMPENLAESLARKLLEKDIFYYSSVAFSIYKEKHQFEEKKLWHIPMAPLSENGDEADFETIMSWAKKWLQYLPYKVQNIPDDANVHDVLGLDQQILCWLEDWVNDYEKKLATKKELVGKNETKAQFKEYMELTADLAKLRMQILKKGRLSDRYFSVSESNKIGTFLNRTKRRLLGEVSEDKDISILLDRVVEAGKTLVFVPVQDVAVVRAFAHKRGLVLCVYPIEETSGDVFVSDKLLHEGWDNVSLAIAETVQSEIDSMLSTIYYPKFGNNTLLADQLLKATSLLKENPFCFSSYTYRQCWYRLLLSVKDGETSREIVMSRHPLIAQSA